METDLHAVIRANILEVRRHRAIIHRVIER
jgi:hypothetical protein